MSDSPAPAPGEIFERAVDEGNRRLDQSLLELISTSFIAGFTVIFGIVALGITEALVEPQGREIAKLAGALAFGPGVVFLVVGRAELFNENFFDPTAAAVDDPDTWSVTSLVRLWVVTLVFNLCGGGLFAGIFAVEGVLPDGAGTALRVFAVESTHHGVPTWFASGVAGGALVALLSHMLVAVDRVESRITLAYIVGALLAVGPFDHVVVTALHGFIGFLFGAALDPIAFGTLLVVVTAGNFVGGLGLVTLTHITQVRSERKSDRS